MGCAADFRSIARQALNGRWLIAVIAGVIAALLGGLGADGPEVKLNIDGSNRNVSFEYAGKTILSTNDGLNQELGALLLGGATVIALIAIVMAVLYFLLGSVIEVGYALFNLDLVDGIEPRIETLFTFFYNWKTTAIASLLRSLYVFLWSILFIIPGIYVAYGYAMTGYVLAEHPELTASEALAQSKQMMEGNRFRLFCLQVSFIGWAILSSFTFGIGNLWLTPYKQAATAAFYREISAY